MKYTLGLSSAEVTLNRPLCWTTAPSDVSSATDTDATIGKKDLLEITIIKIRLY